MKSPDLKDLAFWSIGAQRIPNVGLRNSKMSSDLRRPDSCAVCSLNRFNLPLGQSHNNLSDLRFAIALIQNAYLSRVASAQRPLQKVVDQTADRRAGGPRLVDLWAKRIALAQVWNVREQWLATASMQEPLGQIPRRDQERLIEYGRYPRDDHADARHRLQLHPQKMHTNIHSLNGSRWTRLRSAHTSSCGTSNRRFASSSQHRWGFVPTADLGSVASLIGRLGSGSSAFRLSTVTVSGSLAGACFSPESAHRPFHHGIRKAQHLKPSAVHNAGR